MRSKLHLLLIFLVTVSLFSCKKGGEDATESEKRVLDAWISLHYKDLAPNASGFYFIPVEEGTGAAPVDLDYVYVNYTVEQLNGDVIYSTDSLVADNWGLATAHFAPELTRLGVSGSAQSGIAEAIRLMRVGGKSKLILPSNLAYGLNALRGVSNPLVLKLELFSVFEDIAKNEKDSVVRYKTDNSLTETIDGKDGLYYKQIVQQDTCKGKYLKDYASSVKVWYVGRYLDGYIFDTNIDSVATKAGITASSTALLNVEFGKNGVVLAFEEVVKMMWLQEKTILVTTSEFAYGIQGKGTISPYTPLVFEITIDKIYVKK
ncbi:FKBP-type peptidyl-prolyl cis-trans isomerase [Williamwhitmania taraxaci]|uniref:Peptidyl-prolyl cis-trans isomerase n=1 Tax=Williamwhitmania taraxaci TaxID=1640674 RepID=A0A1G6QF99_9BACT|nr:FKBP-type peptidyl-prolyl cis-trans isomerase [Williamwhitmania taraxaci]SDC90335.1 FKBP-type peptidyl-prolyl cis-trans isomerase [Williamwhitmania taraxaci]